LGISQWTDDPGTFYIGAIADPANEIMEVSEDNNVKVSTSKVTIPDVKSSAFLVTTGSVPLYQKKREMIQDLRLRSQIL
jgi:hypothetical protein